MPQRAMSEERNSNVRGGEEEYGASHSAIHDGGSRRRFPAVPHWDAYQQGLEDPQMASGSARRSSSLAGTRRTPRKRLPRVFWCWASSFIADGSVLAVV